MVRGSPQIKPISRVEIYNVHKFTAVEGAAVAVGSVRPASVVSVGKNAADLGSADGLRSSPRSSCSYWHIYTSCPTATGANHRLPWRHTTSPNLAIWQLTTERLLDKNQTVSTKTRLCPRERNFTSNFAKVKPAAFVFVFYSDARIRLMICVAVNGKQHCLSYNFETKIQNGIICLVGIKYVVWNKSLPTSKFPTL